MERSLTRSSLPEMAGGWGNELMQNEWSFWFLMECILDTKPSLLWTADNHRMIALACLAFTVVHPGLYLPTMGAGRSHW